MLAAPLPIYRATCAHQRARSRYRSIGRIVSVLALAVGMAACAPNYRLKTAPSVFSETWQAAPTAPVAPGPELGAAWAGFSSSELEALIAKARSSNTSIAIATARIMQARGQLGVARAASFPTLSAGIDARGQRQQVADAKAASFKSGSTSFDVAYELDLFGAVAADKRVARSRLAAAVFEREAIRLLIEAEVARTYVEYATLWDRLRLLDRALKNAKELERVVGIQVREGAATQVDLGLQRNEVHGIEADRSRMVEAISVTRNAIAVLTGDEAPSFTLPEATLNSFTVPSFPIVQPGELLVRRPDLAAAEASIAAASGDTDRARAAFLPSLRISSRSIWSQVSGGPLQTVVSAAASVLAPIFDGGRLRGNLLAATGIQHEVVETYRQTLLTALKECEDALTAVEQSQIRQKLMADTIEDSRRTAALARMQYVEGEADLQTVLYAERGLLSVEEALTLATQDRLNAAINIYKAMGGSPADRSALSPSDQTF